MRLREVPGGNFLSFKTTRALHWVLRSLLLCVARGRANAALWEMEKGQKPQSMAWPPQKDVIRRNISPEETAKVEVPAEDVCAVLFERTRVGRYKEVCAAFRRKSAAKNTP